MRDYQYIGPKIVPKNTKKEQMKMVNWRNRQQNRYWHEVFFSDENSIYFDNPSGFKWVIKGKDYTNNIKKRRG